MQVFEAETASEAWLDALAQFRDDSHIATVEGRGGRTRELLHAAFALRNPRQRWVILREPPINPAFAIAEVIWIVSGRNDAAFLNHWNGELKNYAGGGNRYHGAYGFRLRRHLGIDQLERAYLALKHNPNSRQIALQIWDATIDFPAENGQAMNSDIPCNVGALLKVRNSQLEWMQINRSNDMFLGVPYNFVQFTSLQEILAGWLQIEVGTYHHLSDSLHVYEHDEHLISKVQAVEVQTNLDSLSLPKEISDVVIPQLCGLIENMTLPAISNNELRNIVEQAQLPQAYQNLLCVMAAEKSRRKGWMDLAMHFLTCCSNPILVQSWERWKEHRASVRLSELTGSCNQLS